MNEPCWQQLVLQQPCVGARLLVVLQRCIGQHLPPPQWELCLFCPFLRRAGILGSSNSAHAAVPTGSTQLLLPVSWQQLPYPVSTVEVYGFEVWVRQYV
jgi:hypothetical protein